MRKLLRKILTVSLCASLIGGTAAALPIFVPDSGITASAATYSDFEYYVSGSTVAIARYNGSGGDVTIPSKIDGKSVTSIGDSAFEDCRSLTGISIPDSVTSIGDSAFEYCGSLTSITIPPSVTSIEDWAFYNCSSLTSITIPPSVTSIGDWAFAYCNSLSSITIPSGVTSIGNFAFYDCSSLTSITIPDSVTSIGGGAFASCTKLSKITIPDSVNVISYGAFEDTAWYNAKPDGIVYAGKVAYKYKGEVPSEMKIVLKDGTRGIAEGAFQNCSGLKSIMIPSSVTSIGVSALRIAVVLRA